MGNLIGLEAGAKIVLSKVLDFLKQYLEDLPLHAFI